MTTSEIRRALRRRWPTTLAVVVLAIVVAVVMRKELSSVPTGQATTQILVDSPSSSLVNVNVNSAGLTAQASVLAQAMTSQAVLQQVARAAGVPIGSVSAQGPFNGAGEVLDIPTPSEARSMQIVSIKSAYHVSFVAQLNVPIITVTVTGPNPTAAGHVADAVLPGTEAWLSTIAASSTVSKRRQLRLRQLGDAQAGSVNSRSAEEVAVVAAVAVLMLGLLAVVLLDRRVEERRELRRRMSERGELEQAFERDSARQPGGDTTAQPFDASPTTNGSSGRESVEALETVDTHAHDAELTGAGVRTPNGRAARTRSVSRPDDSSPPSNSSRRDNSPRSNNSPRTKSPRGGRQRPGNTR